MMNIFYHEFEYVNRVAKEDLAVSEGKLFNSASGSSSTPPTFKLAPTLLSVFSRLGKGRSHSPAPDSSASPAQTPPMGQQQSAAKKTNKKAPKDTQKEDLEAFFAHDTKKSSIDSQNGNPAPSITIRNPEGTAVAPSGSTSKSPGSPARNKVELAPSPPASPASAPVSIPSAHEVHPPTPTILSNASNGNPTPGSVVSFGLPESLNSTGVGNGKEKLRQLDVDDMIQRLLDVGYTGKASKSLCLKNAEITAICLTAREVFLNQPTLIELSPPVKIVGDVHGQYSDLIRLFEMCGFPPAANYLFLGDYVDRGKQSLETILLLLCYKIKYPENFFLLRGNHECANVTRGGRGIAIH